MGCSKNLLSNLEFLLTAPKGRKGVLETSTNLVEWIPLLTNGPNRDLILPIFETLDIPDRFFRFRSP